MENFPFKRSGLWQGWILMKTVLKVVLLKLIGPFLISVFEFNKEESYLACYKGEWLPRIRINESHFWLLGEWAVINENEIELCVLFCEALQTICLLIQVWYKILLIRWSHLCILKRIFMYNDIIRCLIFHKDQARVVTSG